MRARVRVQAGICGFVADVEATNEDITEPVQLSITSTCENISRLSGALKEAEPLREIREGFNGGILTVTREHLRGCCAGCVVPPAIFKAMQVAAGLALPRDPVITIEKED